MVKKKIKKILHIITNEISILDIPRVMDELGYDVYTANLGIKATGFDKADGKKIIRALEECRVDCVTSYDFSESISYACMNAGIPYISWVYDTPQKELYTPQALYPCNYIFVFDKMQLQRMKDIGIKNIYHMPLAIHGEKIKRELQFKAKRYACDVAFVGQLYCANNTEIIVEHSPENIKNEIDENIKKNFLCWNDNNHMHGNMSYECAEYLDNIDSISIEKKYPLIQKAFYYEAAVFSRMIAFRERVHVLNTLAEKYDVRFYTFEKDTSVLSKNVNVYPGIKHDGGISCVYRDAKININITLHCIETGACQRIFDVMAAGGFMLSNYQKELEELFVPGKEIVLYHNEEELLQLVDYYLSHDKEREEIAKNGQRKVLAHHDYHGRFVRIIDIVERVEKERNKSYFDIQREELIEKTNELLQLGTLDAIGELYSMYHNPVYSAVIENNSSIGYMKEMLYVWRQESEMGQSNLFKRINYFDDAIRMYLRTKHILWRIENNCSIEACQEGVKELVDANISCAFMAWHIKANLSEKKEVYLKLSEYLWNINPSSGVQMISYGLFDYPNDTDLLMYKANFLLEAQCFAEALETMKCIVNPDGEICELITELEAALGM